MDKASYRVTCLQLKTMKNQKWHLVSTSHISDLLLSGSVISAKGRRFLITIMRRKRMKKETMRTINAIHQGPAKLELYSLVVMGLGRERGCIFVCDFLK